MDQIGRKSTPLPVSISKRCRVSIVENWNVHACVLHHWRGEGRRVGGGLSRARLKPRFPSCEKKNTGKSFDTKSQHAKFQQIPSNLKNHNEIGTYAPLQRSPSIAPY